MAMLCKYLISIFRAIRVFVQELKKYLINIFGAICVFIQEL